MAPKLTLDPVISRQSNSPNVPARPRSWRWCQWNNLPFGISCCITISKLGWAHPGRTKAPPTAPVKHEACGIVPYFPRVGETADSYQLPLITLFFRGWRCFLQPGVFTSLPLMLIRTNIQTSVRQCKPAGGKRRALLRASSTFKHETPKKDPPFVHAKGSGRGGEGKGGLITVERTRER